MWSYRNLLNKSLNTRYDEVLEILSEYKELLRNELKNKSYNTYYRLKGLIKIKSPRVIIVGDLHGDLRSLEKILEIVYERTSRNVDNYVFVFLGDYVDRGAYSFETIMSIILMRLHKPENVIMLRGNHEPPMGLIPYPHDLPYFLRKKFGKNWEEIYHRLFEIFQLLPHAAIAYSKLFLVHGGIPTQTTSLHDIAEANNRIELLEELLWNDPSDFISEWTPSPRGAGKLFGIKVSRRFLKENNLLTTIRSHEPCNGFKMNHGGLVITLFSRRGHPYYNTQASILILDLEKVERITEITKGIVLFS